MKTFVFFIALMSTYFTIRGLLAEVTNKTNYPNNFWLIYLPTIIVWTVFYYLTQN